MALPQRLTPLASALVLAVLGPLLAAGDAAFGPSAEPFLAKTADPSLSQDDFVPVGVGSVTRTTYSGPLQQIGEAGVRAVFGTIALVVAFPLLWYNEKRQAKMWRLFGRAHSIAIPNVPAERVDAKHEACLVHSCGQTSTSEVLRDTDFGVAVSDCVKLVRVVEMFQWVEKSYSKKQDTLMGGKETVTTYTYHTDWVSNSVDSAQFKEVLGHENPPMPFKGQEWQAQDVRFGAFRLPVRLVEKLNLRQDLTEKQLPPSVRAQSTGVTLQREGTLSQYTNVRTAMPQVGDLRVAFRRVPCGKTTVLAVQHKDSFAPLTYTMEVSGGKVQRPGGGEEPLLDEAAKDGGDQGEDEVAGCCCLCQIVGKAVEANEEVFEIEESSMSMKDMFSKAETSQNVSHRLLQIFGFVLLFVGWHCILGFFPTLFRLIPLVGTWIQLFGNWLAAAAAFILSVFLWCITVALAWLAMRPLKAACLLVIGVAIVVVPTTLAGRH